MDMTPQKFRTLLVSAWHAVGRGHDSSTINAMKTGFVMQQSPTNSNWQTFTLHDVGHINDYY
jgi:hypothetical protein